MVLRARTEELPWEFADETAGLYNEDIKLTYEIHSVKFSGYI